MTTNPRIRPIRPRPRSTPPAPPTLASRVKALGEAAFGGGLVSGAVAVVASIAAILSQQHSAQAAVEATAAKAKLEQATLALTRERGDKSDQLMVYQRIESQLKDAGPTGVMISASYVSLVKDAAIRATLCQTIESVAQSNWRRREGPEREAYEFARDRVQRLMRDCTTEAWLQQAITANTGFAANSAAPADADQVNAEAPVDRIVSKARVSADGWDVDVFSCQGKPGSAAIADKVAQGLAAISDTNGRMGGERLGRIRLRSLSANAAKQLGATGNLVLGSAPERSTAIALAKTAGDLAGKDSPFAFSQTDSETRWYLSVFTCR